MQRMLGASKKEAHLERKNVSLYAKPNESVLMTFSDHNEVSSTIGAFFSLLKPQLHTHFFQRVMKRFRASNETFETRKSAAREM